MITANHNIPWHRFLCNCNTPPWIADVLQPCVYPTCPKQDLHTINTKRGFLSKNKRMMEWIKYLWQARSKDHHLVLLTHFTHEFIHPGSLEDVDIVVLIFNLHWYNEIRIRNDLMRIDEIEYRIFYHKEAINTLNELWTKVSSRSSTRHFLPSSSLSMGGNNLTRWPSSSCSCLKHQSSSHWEWFVLLQYIHWVMITAYSMLQASHFQSTIQDQYWYEVVVSFVVCLDVVAVWKWMTCRRPGNPPLPLYSKAIVIGSLFWIQTKPWTSLPLTTMLFQPLEDEAIWHAQGQYTFCLTAPIVRGAHCARSILESFTALFSSIRLL